ncbi:MAG: Small-conductance mechanosensitive channel [Burkholderia gladioli]|nr:MAG: Small-conductance mechanosensitive channel [Burkholderia gladioli]
MFLQVLHPFKVGDSISAAGVSGTVKELGLFSTTMLTGDNVVTIVGNNKIFSDTISNYSATTHRRVDLTARIANGVDAREAIDKLRAAILKIPNVMTAPAPDLGILQFTPEGPVLFVRPCTPPGTYLAGLLRRPARDPRDAARRRLSDTRNADDPAHDRLTPPAAQTENRQPPPRSPPRGAFERLRSSFHSPPITTGTAAAPIPTSTITFRYWRMNGMLPKK